MSYNRSQGYSNRSQSYDRGGGGDRGQCYNFGQNKHFNRDCNELNRDRTIVRAVIALIEDRI